MNRFLEFRNKLVLFYQKTDFVLKPAFRFILSLLAISGLRNMFDYSDFFTKNSAVFLLALAAAFLPMSITLAVLVLYTWLLIQPVSMMMSILPLIVYLVMFCFFLRLMPEYSVAVIAMPVLIAFRLPYVIPMAFGLFATPLGIVPACAGVFIYCLLNGIKSNLITIEQVSSKDNPLSIVSDTLNKVIKDENMYALMLVFILIIIVMFLIRSIRMDYAFEISIAIGASALAIGMLILLLGGYTDKSVTEIIICSAISALVMYIAYYLYRPLFYAGTERVRFEDDDYYYYVRAVPKIKIIGADMVTKKLVIDPSLDDDSDENENDDNADAGDDNVFGITRTADDEQDDF